MNRRNILYGYMIRNGIIVLNKQDSTIVTELFEKYLSGQSLLQLSDDLNQRGVEYMPGVTEWNKARIKRLLEDHRYAGEQGYPSVIDEITYQAVQKLKTSRNLQVDTDRRSDIYQLNVPVRCPVCGSFMKRRNIGCEKIQQSWMCHAKSCKVWIKKSDEELLSDLVDLVNLVISNPSMIITRSKKKRSGVASGKIENEIENKLDAPNFDKDQLRSKLFERFSSEYREIDSNSYIDAQMKADFEKSGPLSSISTALFNRTVRDIMLSTDGTVAITLINDQIIQKKATV